MVKLKIQMENWSTAIFSNGYRRQTFHLSTIKYCIHSGALWNHNFIEYRSCIGKSRHCNTYWIIDNYRFRVLLQSSGVLTYSCWTVFLHRPNTGTKRIMYLVLVHTYAGCWRRSFADERVSSKFGIGCLHQKSSEYSVIGWHHFCAWHQVEIHGFYFLFCLIKKYKSRHIFETVRV
jgi:hypothetical protein